LFSGGKNKSFLLTHSFFFFLKKKVRTAAATKVDGVCKLVPVDLAVEHSKYQVYSFLLC
jgi:hypothetical protein